MRIRVELTDGSYEEFDVSNWHAAARQAMTWHQEISESACFTRHTNPVQVKSISLDEEN